MAYYSKKAMAMRTSGFPSSLSNAFISFASVALAVSPFEQLFTPLVNMVEPHQAFKITLLHLPDEFILNIFLDPRLDYMDLKRVSRTCRRLHGIEKVSTVLKLVLKGLFELTFAVH
jgi:hypothetical protein